MAAQTLPAYPLENSYLFNDIDIRIAVDAHGEMYFCAKDVCAVLDIKWAGAGNTLRSIPERWQGVYYHETPGGRQETIFVSEPGLYKLIFRSSKPEAVKFADWVCEEVLPIIRKTGSFGTVPAKDRLAYSRQVLAVAEKLANTKDAMLFNLLTAELRNLCNLIGQKMPDLTLLGRDYRQLGLGIEESA